MIVSVAHLLVYNMEISYTNYFLDKKKRYLPQDVI